MRGIACIMKKTYLHTHWRSDLSSQVCEAVISSDNINNKGCPNGQPLLFNIYSDYLAIMDRGIVFTSPLAVTFTKYRPASRLPTCKLTVWEPELKSTSVGAIATCPSALSTDTDTVASFTISICTATVVDAGLGYTDRLLNCAVGLMPVGLVTKVTLVEFSTSLLFTSELYSCTRPTKWI